ncbi:hypothetical protein P4647_25570 [Peribacillus frigoritolerans]|uniref:hypothetical protein n=1 Tax=Peribacillus frigoritolerans TaxID=450367 RepID=UPI002E1D6F7C|nr:hypothetical protein [Peribacillus frigoritolerans]
MEFLRPVPPWFRFLNDLTGTWLCDDGGDYYIRQIQPGNRSWIYWAGLSQRGVGDDFANVFRGERKPTGFITGIWTDVPYGRANNLGSITLRIEDNGRTLRAIEKAGGFAGSVWTKR